MRAEWLMIMVERGGHFLCSFACLVAINQSIHQSMNECSSKGDWMVEHTDKYSQCKGIGLTD